MDTPRYYNQNEGSLNFRESLKDPLYLPLRQEVIEAFSNNQDFRDFCFENNIFEFLNKEYITSLANYLEVQLNKFDNSKKITLMDVGAGNGRLTQFLKNELANMSERFVIIAVDSGKRNIKPNFPVQKIDQQEALQIYKPDIVIASWMPLGVDWTQDFRNIQNLKQYILIGEAGAQTCGEAWNTWGIDITEERLHQKENPPYTKGGFGVETLSGLSSHQLCRIDDLEELKSGKSSISETISFERHQL